MISDQTIDISTIDPPTISRPTIDTLSPAQSHQLVNLSYRHSHYIQVIDPLPINRALILLPQLTS